LASKISVPGFPEHRERRFCLPARNGDAGARNDFEVT
jgi:hypothetical protein